jgi:uncharacterized protein
MPIGFVDTNILIRYMTNDEVKQAAQAHHLFERVSQEKEHITTSEVVIAEVVHILSSKKLYNISRNDIRTHLERFLRLKGLRMTSKKICIRALELYETTNLDFVDTFIAASVERGKSAYILSFDKKIDRITTTERREP